MMPNKREAIVNCAEAVEAYLDSKDITLTMGGEPTFIVAQPDTPEWSVAAMGPEKLGYARRMTANLIEQVYPGALAMQIFGKWYPGEPLPRWNFMTLYDVKEPLWLETERLLFDDVAGGNAAKDGMALMTAIAQKLDLSESVFPAVEADPGTFHLLT